MEKEYYNQEKANYITQMLKTTKIKRVYWPLITEIILRRNYQFDLGDLGFKRDVNAFVNNIKRIKVKDMKGGALGYCSFISREIILNKNLFDKDTDLATIFEVLAHESNHAMNSSVSKRLKTDNTFNSSNINAMGLSAIIELFTQLEAEAIVQNEKGAHGYGKITPFLDIIASSFGTKKNSLLSNAIKGRNSLNRLLNRSLLDNYSINNNSDNEYFERFALNIGLLYAARYRRKKSIFNKKAGKNRENSIINMKNASKEIFRTAEKVIICRLNNIQANDIIEFKNKFENIVIDEENIKRLMKNQELPMLSEEELKNSTRKVYNLAHIKMKCMNAILNDFTLKDRENLLKHIQMENSADKIQEFLKRNLIYVDMSQEIFIPKWKTNNRNEEILENPNKWDNTKIEQYIFNHKKEMGKSDPSIFNRIITWFSNRTKKLTTPSIKTLPNGSVRVNKPNPNENRKNSWDLENWELYQNDIKQGANINDYSKDTRLNPNNRNGIGWGDWTK